MKFEEDRIRVKLRRLAGFGQCGRRFFMADFMILARAGGFARRARCLLI